MPRTLHPAARCRARRSLLAALTLMALLACEPAAARVASLDGGDASPASAGAASAFDRGLPPAAGATRSARLRGQIVAPELTSSGDHLSVLGALGNPEIAKEPARGFVLDTAGGPVQIAPAWVDREAPAPATIDDAAAVFPSMAAEVDALLRPTATGVTTLLQLRSALAAESFAWTVALPAPHSLRQLDDGGVAVVAGGGAGAAAAPPPAARRIDEAALNDPAEQYEEAREAGSQAAAESSGEVLAVIAPPRARDRRGRPVPVRLAVRGALIELTVEHRRGTVDHAVFAELTATTPDALDRPWRDLPGTGPVQPGPDGLLKVLLEDGEVFLTHGPDPAGYDPAEGEDPLGDSRPYDLPPEEEENDDGAPWAAGTGPPFLCYYGFGSPRRIKVLYAGPEGGLTASTHTRIQRVMAGANNKLYDESVASGGRSNPARLRFDCDKRDEIQVVSYELDRGDFRSVIVRAKRAGHTDPHVKYVIFSEYEQKGACGEANQYPDDRLARDNKANRGAFNETVDGQFASEGTYAILYGRFCWQVDIALHENAHTMGAVEDTAPHATGRGHCDDGYDVMCYDDRSSDEETRTYREDACELGPRGMRYDCNYDTYFDTEPESGSWLATHWNLGHKYNLALGFEVPRTYRERFLVAGFADDGTGMRRIYAGTRGSRAVEPVVEGDAMEPALSPDAESIVYVAPRPGHGCFELHHAKIDGTDARRLVDCTERENTSMLSPAWAGSNAKLLMTCADGDGTLGRDICDMELDDPNPAYLIAWEGHQERADETGSRRLVAFDSTHTPDGDRVDAQYSQIFMTKRDGSRPVQFTTGSRFDNASNPKFSQDGNRVAFEGWEPGEGRPHIYVARIDGTGLRQVTHGIEERNPTWTPDGRLAYSEFLDGGLWQTVEESPASGDRTVLASRLMSVDQPTYRQAAYWQLGFRTPTPKPIP